MPNLTKKKRSGNIASPRDKLDNFFMCWSRWRELLLHWRRRTSLWENESNPRRTSEWRQNQTTTRVNHSSRKPSLNYLFLHRLESHLFSFIFAFADTVLTNRWQQYCKFIILEHFPGLRLCANRIVSLIAVVVSRCRYRGLPALCPRSDIRVHQWGPQQSSPQTPAVGSHTQHLPVRTISRAKAWCLASSSSSPPLLQVTRTHKPQRDRTSQQGRWKNNCHDVTSSVYMLWAPLCILSVVLLCSSSVAFIFLSMYHRFSSCILPVSAASSQLITVFLFLWPKRFCASCHEKHLLLPLAEAETFRHSSGGRRGLHQIQQRRLYAESECKQSSRPGFRFNLILSSLLLLRSVLQRLLVWLVLLFLSLGSAWVKVSLSHLMEKHAFPHSN